MVDVISRAKAMSDGLKLYFTGNACPYGHKSHRYVSNYKCVSCAKDAAPKENEIKLKKYYSDPEYAELCKQRSRAHLLGIKNDPQRLVELRVKKTEYARKKRIADPVFLEKNRKASRDAKKRWGEEQKEKHRIHARNRRARKKGAEGRYRVSDVRKIYADQDGLCAACRCNLLESGSHVDHIMPIALGGTNWPDNIQILCPPCNLSKSAKHPDVWLKNTIKYGVV